jgi:hypothetical protein
MASRVLEERIEHVASLSLVAASQIVNVSSMLAPHDQSWSPRPAARRYVTDIFRSLQHAEPGTRQTKSPPPRREAAFSFDHDT